jgi:DNA adenine methylase
MATTNSDISPPTCLKSPFPWYGGKRKVAPLVWKRFGDTINYVEPFAGSLAVLLGRPNPKKQRIETVNELNPHIANFWRALQHDPLAMAKYADYPILEADLHARHNWLVNSEEAQAWRERMLTDPDYYDAKIAGWWVWGINQWTIGGWCIAPQRRTRPHLGDGGLGVHRKLLWRKQGEEHHPMFDWMDALAERLRYVRVCCGDWERVCTPAVTYRHGMTAVFLDPPYSTEERTEECYADNGENLAARVRQWAIENGDHPQMRIALCGYDEHEMPRTWECVAWTPQGGYAHLSEGKYSERGEVNRHRERIWFSPHCLHSAHSVKILPEIPDVE